MEKIARTLIGAVFAAVLVSACPIAIGASALVLERSVPIRLDGDPLIMPAGIAALGGTDVVVTGRVSTTGWIARVSGDTGHVVWQRTVSAEDELAPSANVESIQPVLYAPILLADGGILVVGHMPRPSGSQKPQYFTLRLNSSNGAVEHEGWFGANPPDAPQIQFTVVECTSTRDGAALLGVAYKVIRKVEPGLRPIVDNFYWLATLDAQGRLSAEHYIPEKDVSPIVNIGDLGLVALGDKLVLSISDTNETEIIVADGTGHPVSRRPIAGHYQLVRPPNDGLPIQLIGAPRHADRTNLISFDGGLTEIGRQEVCPCADFLGTSAFRLQDRSLVQIGNQLEFGRVGSPAAIHLNPESGKIDWLSLRDDSRFVRQVLWYGAETGNRLEIATVRCRLLEPGIAIDADGTDRAGAGNGSLLTYINLERP